MKKKQPQPIPEPVIAPEILELAKRAATAPSPDQIRRVDKCTVCGSDCSTTSNDQLCWVCRRLKISAWRDSDIQMNVQE